MLILIGKTITHANITIVKGMQNASSVQRKKRSYQSGVMKKSKWKRGTLPLEEGLKVHQVKIVGRTDLIKRTL